jgi:S-adenosylmethionine decarboxylase
MTSQRAKADGYIQGMKGLHLTADLYRCRCDPAWLQDARQLQDWCAAAIEAVGLRPAGHAFSAGPSGVVASVLMEDAHVCLHTWPGEKAVTLDVYVAHAGGDHSAKARGLMFALVNRFQPEWTEQRSLDRGEEE